MQSKIQKLHGNSKKAPIWRKLLTRRTLLGLGLSSPALAMLPLCAELRIKDASQLLTDEWSRMPVEPRNSAFLGISFRPLQAQAFGLELRPTLNTLLQYPIQIV